MSTREVPATANEPGAVQRATCRRCRLGIEHVPGAGWVPLATGTTADGLTYCPPDPDYTGRLGSHVPVTGTIRTVRDAFTPY